MYFFALGTPVIDIFANVEERVISSLSLKKGASNYFSSKKIAKIERKLKGKIYYRYAGDNARNVCEGFSALGGMCGFQGAVGNDKDGAYFAANLEKCGVGNFLEQIRGKTGKAIVLLTPDGQRTFCLDLGVSTKCRKENKLAIDEARMLFLTSITIVKIPKLSQEYMEECRKRKKQIAVSLESAPMVKENRRRLLSVIKKYVDILFLNEEEANALVGGNGEKKLLSLKPQIPVFLKKGKHGSMLIYKGKVHGIAAIDAKILDTTGAGDAYAAGVLYGISRGYSFLSSAKIGCYLATKVIEKVGAGVPLAHTRFMR